MNAVTAIAPAPTGQLGTIVSWRLPNEIAYDVLKNAMATAGMDPDLAPELHPTHALSRALGEMRKGRVIRKLRRDDKWEYFQLTKEFLDEHEITYEKETEVGLNVETGEIACQDTGIKAATVDLLAKHLAQRLTGDLTRLMQRYYKAFKADLIPIREQGGAYFVPEMHRGLVDTTRIFLTEIGGRLRNFDVRLGSDDTSASVAESMTEYLKQLLGEFKESCEGVDGASRKDVKENRMATASDLRRKLELYRGLLSGYADHIDEEIKTAEVSLLRQLAQGGKDAAQ